MSVDDLLKTVGTEKNILFGGFGMAFGLMLIIGSIIWVYKIEDEKSVLKINGDVCDVESEMGKENCLNSVSEPEKIDISSKNKIVIDVSGAVVEPGLYYFGDGARVNDVLSSAGGLDGDVDLEWVQKELNLARLISDGEKLYIPFEGEYDEDSDLVDISAENPGLISINNGDVEELSKLSGIGDSTAKKIIEYRDKSGGFSSIEEIMEVPGVGEKMFSEIQNQIEI